MKKKTVTVRPSKNKNEVLEVVLALKDSMENMENRMDSMETKMDSMETKMDTMSEHMENSFTEVRERLTNLERGQDEILDELRPLSRAHSADAITIINHEQRIKRLEKQIA